MRFLAALFVILAFIFSAGCDAATSAGEKPEVRLKRMLENVAQVGDINTVKQDVESAFKQLKADSPAKASAIDKEMQSLLKLSNKNQIKEKAGQIAILL